jgi:putative NADPH-quinone reductase
MKNLKVLVLFAHPSQHRSEVNMPLFKVANELSYVTAVDLYQEYPDFQIDIEKEQQRLKAHDVIIFQFPLYWYSTPSILKEWQDLVLEYGFAYGVNGTELKDKIFFCALSAGGNTHAYSAKGHNNFKIRELLHPLEQTANLTSMIYLPPFVLFGARTAVEENRLSKHIENWKNLLTMLHVGELDINKIINDDTLSLTLNSALNTHQIEGP